MAKTFADVLAAAAAHDCPILHLSKPAGKDPFVPNEPCLGDATGPLIDLSVDEYLGVCAELRRSFVLERSETFENVLQVAGGADDVVAARHKLTSRMLLGYIEFDGAQMALSYLLDAAGQETTIVYRHLRSTADVQSFWKLRAAPPA